MNLIKIIIRVPCHFENSNLLVLGGPKQYSFKNQTSQKRSTNIKTIRRIQESSYNHAIFRQIFVNKFWKEKAILWIKAGDHTFLVKTAQAGGLKILLSFQPSIEFQYMFTNCVKKL